MSAHSVSAAHEDPFSAALDHAAHLLPAQGPLSVFVHHNTLHAFEHLPFHEAVLEAERALGGRPYLEEDEYREHLRRGRITEADVEAAYERVYGRALADEVEEVAGLVGRGALRRTLLLHAVRAPAASEVPFLLHDAGGLDRPRADLPDESRVLLGRGAETPREMLRALHAAAEAVVPAEPQGEVPETPFARHRDAIAAAVGIDIDTWIHPVLISWSAAFLDRGTAYWPLPERADGFYRAVRRLESLPGAVRPAWAKGVGALFRDQEARGLDAEAAAREALADLGVEPARYEAYLAATLGALSGFAGMFRRLEQETEIDAPGRPTLLDFLAVRLTYERCAVRAATEQAGVARKAPRAWLEMVRAAERLEPASAAYVLFQLFQLLGLRPARARQLGRTGARALLGELRAFGDRARRRVWQEAFELHLVREIAGAIAGNTPAASFEPRFQVVTCLDEREEAFRRHIEEVDPLVETLGGAGFFGLPVDYRGLDDASATARCPVVVVPDREIHEQPLSQDVGLHEARRTRRRLLASLRREIGTSSRMFVRGAVLNALVGWLAVLPMAARVLFPRLSARLQRTWAERVVPRPRTRLSVEPAPHHEDEEMLLGMPLAERIDRTASFLEGLGLARRLSPLVLLLGHGSTSLNNPLESAYHCGACGGRRGGPNARLFAHFSNDPEVRAGLAERGLPIPAGTWFVGGEHDTCSDAVTFHDTEEIPAEQRARFEGALRVLDAARARTAHERCRRFEHAPARMSPERALREVERRAAAYDEPRPEYGHATNAFAVVGRRARTRGLFLDRRGFLISYDPATDDDGAVLARLLGAVVPVCAGITLEYYFSSVDNERYGCGTKLPHNLVASLGVMNGASSDLRTGLARQMVEIHEPLRLLMIVEQTREQLVRVVDRLPAVKALVEREWIRLAALDPERGEVSVLAPGGRFWPAIHGPAAAIPEVEVSADHYAGHREHLGPARVRAALRGAIGVRAEVA